MFSISASIFSVISESISIGFVQGYTVVIEMIQNSISGELSLGTAIIAFVHKNTSNAVNKKVNLHLFTQKEKKLAVILPVYSLKGIVIITTKID
jgi:hypothetical protein